MKLLIFFASTLTIIGALLAQNTKSLNQKTNVKLEEKITLVSGVEIFLSNPTRYNFLCTATSKGEVLSASLAGDGKMLVEYASFWDDGDHSGITEGVYDKKTNCFRGRYKTNDGRFSGEINFSFNEKGEAFGTWDNGYGTIKIPLKKEKN